MELKNSLEIEEVFSILKFVQEKTNYPLLIVKWIIQYI